MLLLDNFFCRKPALITSRDLMDGHASSVNSNASTADVRRTAQKSVAGSAHN